MHIADEEIGDLKAWVVKKLEDISDADSDVLADYVLALIKADDPEPELKLNAISQLDDFLKDKSARFVDDLLFSIHTKSFLPGYTIPASQPVEPILPAPSGSGASYIQLGTRGGLNGATSQYQQSRKRSYNDRQEGNNGESYSGRGDRQNKLPRVGGIRGSRGDSFGGRGGRGGRSGQNHPISIEMPPDISYQATSGMPFDPNDPMAAMLMMQAIGAMPPLPPMPLSAPAGSPTGFPPFGGQSSPGLNAPPKQRISARCRDYDTKGFCTRGSTCPFEHGTDHIVVPGQQDEYDPKNSLMMDVKSSPTKSNGFSSFKNAPPLTDSTRGRGRGRGGIDRGGDRGSHNPQRRNRAEFSYAGPNHDRSVTTIVVEQIPEDHFDEQQVRAFFTEFGTIEDVTMQAYKRLALVKYSEWAAAQRAYDSPKVIFDNRFVKVYWYKPDSLPTPPTKNGIDKGSSPNSKPEEPVFDKEKFERDAMAAQKKLEEKKALLKDTDAKRQELEKQKEELARKQAEETKKLMEKLAAKKKTGRGSSPGDSTISTTAAENGGTANINDKASAQTEALRAQLRALESEAKSLGIDTALIDTDPWAPRGRGRGRGRGSYRGWEGFRGGGGYDPSYRGRGRGSGAFRGRGATLGPHSLDNRTKKVAVSGVEFDEGKDEALRQYLLGIGEFSSISPFPSSSSVPSSSQTITFKERFTAENFIHGPKDIPGVGRVELAWVQQDSPAAGHSNRLQPDYDAKKGLLDEGGDTGMGGADVSGDNGGGGGSGVGVQEVDYDVAEEDDRWMVE